MRFDIITIFPRYFDSALSCTIIGKAIDRGLISVGFVDVRDFSSDKNGSVDDHPYGGGPGMVMMVDPMVKAIRSVKRDSSLVIYLTPQGRLLNASVCEELSAWKHIILVCGHYSGIDQRIIDLEVDREISMGDYVVTNGGIAALVVLDSLSRFVPGVLGDARSVRADSFQNGKVFEAPLYTRPRDFEGLSVPDVLLSGDDKRIAEWKSSSSIQKLSRVRPELLRG